MTFTLRVATQPKDTLLSINSNVLDAGEASINTAVSLIRKSGGAPIEVCNNTVIYTTTSLCI